jgi:hypothetical protein
VAPRYVAEGMRATRLACSAILTALLSARLAFSDDNEGAEKRRALLDKAQSARTASRHDEALELARKASTIKTSSSLRRFIAEELSALERYAEAYNEAKRCTEDAATEAPSPNHDVVFLGCRSLVHDLAGKVALLSFDWGGPPPEGLAVSVNGEPLDQAPEHAVTPGAVAIEATAPDKKMVAKKVELHGGEVKVVEVRFEGVAAGPSPSAPTAKVASEHPPQATLVRGRLWGPIVGGIGLASAATGVVLLATSESRFNSLKSSCPSPMNCTESDASKESKEGQIRTLETWGNITLISGIGLAAAGTLWFVLDRRPSPKASATDWRVGFSPGAIDVSKSF